jgi:thiopurine S-methyltransferase
MKSEFWHKCWERNHLGFHQVTVHPFLTEHLEGLIKASEQHVFVPLCGKSLDMVWLAERMQVSGAELSEIACRDFFTDKQLDYQTKVEGEFTRFSFEEIDLWQGDFFKLKLDRVIDNKANKPSNKANARFELDWIYDRAAIIALPESMQQAYVDHLLSFMSANTKLLLVSIEFPETEMSGPPFPLFQQDIKKLFAGYKIEVLAANVIEDKCFAQRVFEVSYLTERLYLITKA